MMQRIRAPESQAGAHRPGRRLLALLALPDWLRERPADAPWTEEEQARLRDWIAQQMGGRMITRDDIARPPPRPD